MKKVLIVLAAVVVLGGLAFAGVKMTSNKKSNNKPAVTPAPTVKTDNGTVTAPILIKYTNSGFTPAKVSVKSGTRITIKNDASESLQFNSDPHPSHTDNSELNVGNVPIGQDKTFAVTKSGEWGYHNHFSPSDKGTIVVQ